MKKAANNRAVILHYISDAEHFVKNNLYKGALLFSTHSSVDVYMKEFYGLDCQCLSNFLSPEEVINMRNISFETVDRILKDLDTSVSPLINSQFTLNMRYFVPLYSYLGKHHFHGYACFVEAVKKVMDIFKLNKFIFYDYKFDDFFCVNSDMEYFITLFFYDLETQVIKYTKDINSRNANNIRKIISILKKNKRTPLYAIKKAVGKIEKNIRFRYRKYSNKRKTILFYEPTYDLHFLIKNLYKYNVLYYKENNKPPLGFKYKSLIDNVTVNFQDFDFIVNKENPFARIFLKDIKEDFLKNINQYINVINLLRNINEKLSNSLGIWGGPPIAELKALIFEFLKSENVKILGAQHGCLYGEVQKLLHFDSDFNRCDYFISYGFTKEDLNRLYPNTKLNTEILPFGSEIPTSKNNSKKKKIDILFPMTNSMSIFEGGMIRISPDKLTERQVRLLEYLNTIEGLDVYVKPFRDSCYGNCSVLPVLKRLGNLKVVDYMTLTEFLNKYSPKAVLIEYPSQPLFDVLHLNTEIFLLNDYMHPYEDKALEKLKKRVHYSEDVDEIISKIDLLLKGKLERKRDDTFYRHYVHKKNRKENILRLIDELVEERH